ncbi:MAG: glutamine-hydrolyzing carbamoyl-phosphate synthase small subunit [Clostridia bacterium]|nr:glutamine-hydrolyzing carbamoyl-phosphate synthase small subunit [Clostridia bacterium]
MFNSPDRKIILEDGSEYTGYSFGSDSEKILEIVFNTSMVGYQEILSDPSYTDQAVVMTYPLIGNYGMCDDDYESKSPSIGALIVREYCDEPSNFRSSETLSSVMKKYGITGVQGVDTRKLNRSIRDFGSRIALITSSSTTLEDALSKIRAFKAPKDQVARVSVKAAYEYPCEHAKYHVVAIDCGMKENILRSLAARGCRVTVMPYNTSFDEISKLHPDGLFISNGPGNPENVPETIETVKKAIGHFPVFGICLGHQIIALACGAKTYKLKFGHRGGNHPVKDLTTGLVEITSQNHSFAVDEDSLNNTILTTTHINLLDGTVEGLSCVEKMVFSVQYHPESAPGPQDSGHLFDRFTALMEREKTNA